MLNKHKLIMCVSVCMHMCEYRCLWILEDGIWVTGCEPPDVGAGNQTQVPLEEKQMLLITETLLQLNPQLLVLSGSKLIFGEDSNIQSWVPGAAMQS